MTVRVLGLAVLLLVLAGCSGTSGPTPDKTTVRDTEPTTAGIAPVDYWRDIKPILDHRCVVCHGCYDAPCQLNLTAFEGVARGANKDKVYDSTRLVLAEPTRLFEDAKSLLEWRNKGFYPVLNEKRSASIEARQAGVLARMLALKREHPLPPGQP